MTYVNFVISKNEPSGNEDHQGNGCHGSHDHPCQPVLHQRLALRPVGCFDFGHLGPSDVHCVAYGTRGISVNRLTAKKAPKTQNRHTWTRNVLKPFGHNHYD